MIRPVKYLIEYIKNVETFCIGGKIDISLTPSQFIEKVLVFQILTLTLILRSVVMTGL